MDIIDDPTYFPIADDGESFYFPIKLLFEDVNKDKNILGMSFKNMQKEYYSREKEYRDRIDYVYFTYNGVNEGECDFTTLRKDTCITKEEHEEEELETKLAEVGIYQGHRLL